MATRTFRMVNAAHASGWQDSAEADQTAANATAGWTYGKTAAGNYSSFAANTKRGSGTFSTTAEPDNETGLRTALKDAMILHESGGGAFTGSFDTTGWVFSIVGREGTSNAGVGRLRIRVWAATSTDGVTGLRELTGAVQVTGTGNWSTSADTTVTVTWTPGATITLTGEYVFVQMAYEITTAAGATGADFLFRVGSSTNGTRVQTGNWTAGGGTTYNQACAVAMTGTVGTVKQAGKLIAMADTFTAAVSKNVNHAIALGATLTPAVAKQVNKLVALTTTVTAAVAKQVNKVAAIALTGAVTVAKAVTHSIALGVTLGVTTVKQVGKNIAVGMTGTVATAATKVFLQTCAVGMTMTVGVVKQAGKVITLLLQTNNYSAGVLADSPVGYWRFEETSGTVAADELGAHNGTYEANTTPGAGTVIGKAPRFTASTTSGVDVASAPAFAQSGGGFTLELWAQVVSATGGVNPRLFETGNSDVRLHLTTGSNTMVGQLNQGGLQQVGWNYASSTLLDGNKHHLAMRYSGGLLSIWFDGTKVAELNIGGAVNIRQSALRIGNSPGSVTAGDGFNGYIDEVAWYSTALSDQRIQAHAQNNGASGVVVVKQVAKSFAPALTATVATAKRISKTFALTMTGTVVAAAQKVFLKAIAIGMTLQVRQRNRTDFSAWTAAGGSPSYDATTNTWTMSLNDVIQSPFIYVRDWADWSIYADFFSSTLSAEPTFAGFSGMLWNASYFKEDKVATALNSSGFTGNGNAQKYPQSTWTRKGWTYNAGNEVWYIRFSITADSNFWNAGASTAKVRDLDVFFPSTDADAVTHFQYTTAGVVKKVITAKNVAMTATVSGVRQVGKIAAVAMAGTVAVTKRVSKSVAVTLTGAVTTSRVSTFLKTISVGMTLAVSNATSYIVGFVVEAVSRALSGQYRKPGGARPRRSR